MYEIDPNPSFIEIFFLFLVSHSGTCKVSVHTPLRIHVYKLVESGKNWYFIIPFGGRFWHFFFKPFSDIDGGEIEVSEDVSAATCHVLPNVEFDGLWESLIYDSNLKDDALRYVETAMIASECKSITQFWIIFDHGTLRFWSEFDHTAVWYFFDSTTKAWWMGPRTQKMSLDNFFGGYFDAIRG